MLIICLPVAKEAGRWMFNTDDFTILNNAIDTESYIYDEEKSLNMRNKLGIENKFVVGHVGDLDIKKIIVLL